MAEFARYLFSYSWALNPGLASNKPTCQSNSKFPKKKSAIIARCVVKLSVTMSFSMNGPIIFPAHTLQLTGHITV